MPETMPPSTAFNTYNAITAVTSRLLCVLDEKTQTCTTEFDYDSIENPDLLKKLLAVNDYLADHTLVYTLLKNVPNVTFEKLYKDLGPHIQDSIVYCKNAGRVCKNMDKLDTGLFPKCFTYKTQENKSDTLDKNFSGEGISNGVIMIIMVGTQLAAEALNEKFPESKVPLYPDFMNTHVPVSTNGIRLMLHIPEGIPNLDQEGINIEPGHSTLLAIRGRERVKLPEPYSSCTDEDPELKLLRESVLKDTATDNVNNNNAKYKMSAAYKPYLYTSQGCRDACLQKLIWKTCHCLDLKSKLPFPDVDGKLLCGALGAEEMEILLDPKKYDKEGCLFNLTKVVSTNCTHLHKIINDLYCIKEVKQIYNERKLLDESMCDCPPACHSFDYDVIISDSSWPSPGAETNAAYNKMKHVNWTFSHNAQIMEYFNNSSNKNAIMQNFAQVIVYNKHLSIEKIEEVPAYTLDNLFADIGKLWSF